MTDAVLVFFVFAAVAAISPILVQFIGLGVRTSTGFSELLIQAAVPLLILAFLMSAGIGQDA
jgi:hypothetical protein